MATPDAPTGLGQNFVAHFQKSNFFRVIHSDGAYGGITARGNIHCTFFSERGAIPKRAQINVNPDGTAAETVVETIGGVVRELEVDVVMELNTAVALIGWLEPKVEELRKAIGISDTDWAIMRAQSGMGAK